MKNSLVSYQFPEDFLWGAATASYQIEGATEEDGRQPSVWDSFSRIPGKILNGDTGAVACDHYHRYQEDIQLMVELGIKNYRFSIAWPRIIPEGRGTVNEQGVDFYKRLVDNLLNHGITPHATLFHWDSPQALENLYGSWQNRQMAYDYADYVSAVVSRLGDRIINWFTINEITCFTHMSYAAGKPASLVNLLSRSLQLTVGKYWSVRAQAKSLYEEPPHAPGKLVSSQKEVWQTSHHALLAHGLGCQAIRAASPVPCSVALVDNFAVTVPLNESSADIEAAKKAFHVCGQNGGIIFPALTGNYSQALLEELGANSPEIKEGDLKTINQHLDALGFNIYSGTYVRAADNKQGYEFLSFPKGYPKLYMPWLNILPESLYWGIRHISETLGRPDLPILITENGCAAQDTVNAQGEVIDTDRIMYLRQHLKAAHRAVSEGYPLKGYFLWSLLDNFEWSYGYDRRFGITYIDYPTQKRIPKASFDWYRQCIKNNRVV